MCLVVSPWLWEYNHCWPQLLFSKSTRVSVVTTILTWQPMTKVAEIRRQTQHCTLWDSSEFDSRTSHGLDKTFIEQHCNYDTSYSIFFPSIFPSQRSWLKQSPPSPLQLPSHFLQQIMCTLNSILMSASQRNQANTTLILDFFLVLRVCPFLFLLKSSSFNNTIGLDPSCFLQDLVAPLILTYNTSITFLVFMVSLT